MAGYATINKTPFLHTWTYFPCFASTFQHMFDGGVYRLEGVSSVGGKMVVTVHTPGEQAIVARGNRRGNTVQIRQKGELWIVLNL